MLRLRVLVYHDIVPRSEWPLDGPGRIRTAQGQDDRLPERLYSWRDQFEAQLDWLGTSGWSVVSPEAVALFYRGEGELPERSALITVDDLWKQGMSAAAAGLRRRGWRALAFMVRGWIFDDPQPERTGSPVCLSRGELEPLKDVFAFGNHGDRLHLRGASIEGIRGVDPFELAADLARCEEWTTLPRVFAYPFGARDESAVRVLAREGYRLAFTIEPGENGADTDPMALRRDVVPRDLSLEGFAELFR
jgi:peptidoglycan/xylan/chitin deacetylase (PgdA/CDA1 family)